MGELPAHLVSLLHVFHDEVHSFLLRIQMCISIWLFTHSCFKLQNWVYGIWQEGSKMLGSVPVLMGASEPTEVKGINHFNYQWEFIHSFIQHIYWGLPCTRYVLNVPGTP